MCETGDSSWRLPGYFLLTCVILLLLRAKKIKYNCFMHTHISVTSAQWGGHGARACTHTCQHKLSCAGPCSYLLQQVPNHQEALSSEHLLLHGHWALQQLHQERQQGGAARHTPLLTAALVLLATSRFCMFLFCASLFTLLSGCILVCDHCLPDNW